MTPKRRAPKPRNGNGNGTAPKRTAAVNGSSKIARMDNAAVQQRFEKALAKTGRLTPMQAVFAQEYLIDLNPTKAARRAGYSHPETNGYRLINTPHIQKAIQEAMDARAARTQITADRVIRELGRIGFADPGKYFNEDTGALETLADLTEDDRAAISELTVSEETDSEGNVVGFIKKLKLHPKHNALTSLAKHLQILHEKVEFEGNVHHTHEHNHQLNLNSLEDHELQVLTKALGMDLLEEDAVCPPLQQ